MPTLDTIAAGLKGTAHLTSAAHPVLDEDVLQVAVVELGVLVHLVPDGAQECGGGLRAVRLGQSVRRRPVASQPSRT